MASSREPMNGRIRRAVRQRGPEPREAVAAAPEDDLALERAHPSSSADLTPVLGANLRKLRMKRGLSLERLSKLSGVSRAMLGQIELGQSAPTVNVLWKISVALGVPFSALISSRQSGSVAVLRSEQAKRLTSHDGSFVSRALFPFDEPRRVEFYELKMAPRCEELADAHAPGTVENLVVSQGAVEIEVGGAVHALGSGDAIVFEADTAHVYRNPSNGEAIMYLIMTYADTVG